MKYYGLKAKHSGVCIKSTLKNLNCNLKPGKNTYNISDSTLFLGD